MASSASTVRVAPCRSPGGNDELKATHAPVQHEPKPSWAPTRSVTAAQVAAQISGFGTSLVTGRDEIWYHMWSNIPPEQFWQHFYMMKRGLVVLNAIFGTTAVAQALKAEPEISDDVTRAIWRVSAALFCGGGLMALQGVGLLSLIALILANVKPSERLSFFRRRSRALCQCYSVCLLGWLLPMYGIIVRMYAFYPLHEGEGCKWVWPFALFCFCYCMKKALPDISMLLLETLPVSDVWPADCFYNWPGLFTSVSDASDTPVAASAEEVAGGIKESGPKPLGDEDVIRDWTPADVHSWLSRDDKLQGLTARFELEGVDGETLLAMKDWNKLVTLFPDVSAGLKVRLWNQLQSSKGKG